ncbi:MAG: hypothetical protein ACREKS_12525 [Candidatus Rokuibacteriota bacterium]
MGIIAASALLGLIGVVASRLGLTRLTASDASRDGHVYWAVGVGALGPAWLIAFVGLLPTAPGLRPQLASAASWLLSGAAALIGAIVTQARVRDSRERAEAGRATRLWCLGVLALLPAWLIALGGHVVR